MPRYRLFKRAAGSIVTPPPVDPETGSYWWIGLSCSREGLSGSEANKRTLTLSQVAAMADQAGISAAALRAETFWHGYNPGVEWNAASESHFQWALSNGFKGIVMNQKTPDNATGWATFAAGGYDQNFRDYLTSIQGLRTGFKVCVIFNHEPNNNVVTQAQATNWCKGQARFMKIVAELNDPDIMYSLCYVPNSGKSVLSWWNPRPSLDALFGGNTTASQAIMDRTWGGLDVYPTANRDGSPQTIASRLNGPMTTLKSWGFTRFSYPEVGLTWSVGGTFPAGRPTPYQQAKRLADELWTWSRANGVEMICYFDNAASAADAAADELIIDTPQEYLVYSRIIRNITPTPIPA